MCLQDDSMCLGKTNLTFWVTIQRNKGFLENNQLYWYVSPTSTTETRVTDISNADMGHQHQQHRHGSPTSITQASVTEINNTGLYKSATTQTWVNNFDNPGMNMIDRLWLLLLIDLSCQEYMTKPKTSILIT